MVNKQPYFILFLFVLLSSGLAGQIDMAATEKQFGDGETSFKKTISISFVYDESNRTYQAKVSHRYDKLYINENTSKGLVQVPFNTYQEVKLETAKYFKIDSAGTKRLIENVKVKYADVKDYFIENIFYADLKVKQFNCSVKLPKNYFVSYSYDVIYNDLKFLTSFYLQDANEAVKEVEISIKKDVNVDLAVFDFNFGDQITREEDDNYIRFKGKNLKRIVPAVYSVGGSYYLPHIIVSVKSIETTEKTSEILKSTTSQYNWYNSLISELAPDQNYLKNLSGSIIEGASTDQEKIDRIFRWVQNNVQYVAFENGIAGFKPTEAEEVAQSKYGDCKGMANLLVNLLQSQGFDARHAWIGTRSNNYNYSIPSLVVDNHMICALKYNNALYFLDGTSKSAKWNIPPAHLEGKEVMIANGNEFIIETIKKSDPENNTINIKGSLDLKSKQPQIKLSVELTGHFKQDFISYTTYSPLKSKKDVPFYFMNDYLHGIKVEGISEPVITPDKITFELSGYYMNIARSQNTSSLFPFLNIFKYGSATKKNPPVYINYPQTINVTMSVLGAGKAAKEQYTNATIGQPDFHINYYTSAEGGNTVVHQQLYLNVLHSPLTEKEKWIDFVNQVKAFNNYPLSYE